MVEDTPCTVAILTNQFGPRVAEMVDRLTRDRPNGNKWSVEEVLNAAYLKNDNEVILIKLLDRLHNMQTIGFKPPEKQKKTVKETLENFIVLALYLDRCDISKQLHKYCH